MSSTPVVPAAGTALPELNPEVLANALKRPTAASTTPAKTAVQWPLFLSKANHQSKSAMPTFSLHGNAND